MAAPRFSPYLLAKFTLIVILLTSIQDTLTAGTVDKRGSIEDCDVESAKVNAMYQGHRTMSGNEIDRCIAMRAEHTDNHESNGPTED